MNGRKQKIIVLKNRAKITATLGRIVISQYDVNSHTQLTTRYTPDEIRSIIIIYDTSITKSALHLLCDKDVIFLKSGSPIYYLTPFKKITERLILEKKLAKLNKSKKNKLAYIFCKGSCIGKIYHAKRINEYRNSEDISKRIQNMRDLQKKLIKCVTSKEMIAIEANIAKHYFSIFKLLLPKEFGFTRRNRHDGDILNVLLNAAHSLMRKRILRILTYNGINSSYGFLHWQEDKRKHFLSWDFAELWLPYVDRLCFYAVLKGIFKNEDRITALNGVNPYWLSERAWQKLYELVYNRIKDDELQSKIDHFRDFLLYDKRFGWKVK